MNHWNTLNIAPTNDKKAIKKAYAILLKQNKPDENPKGFAELNRAYKQCLSESAYIALELEAELASSTEVDIESASEPTTLAKEPATELIKETVEVYQTAENDQIFETGQTFETSQTTEIIGESLQDHIVIAPDDITNDSLDEADNEEISEEEREHNLYIDNLNHAWARIVSDTEAVLTTFKKVNTTELWNSSTQHTDNPEQWNFIHSYEEMYDFQFKTNYSYYLFEQLLNYFENNSIPPSQYPLTLKKLNDTFQWLDQQFELENEFGSEKVRDIFDDLQAPIPIQERKLKWIVNKKHNGPIETASAYARLAATGIDLLIILFVFGAIFDVFYALLYGLPFYAITSLILEASPVQGGLGKVLFGLKVTTPKGERLNVFYSFWRQFCFIGSLTSVKFTWPVHLIQRYFIPDKFLHDYLSRSIVIKRYKSENQYQQQP